MTTIVINIRDAPADWESDDALALIAYYLNQPVHAPGG